MIGVFKVKNGEEIPIGKYTRNYHALFNTFFPFEMNGKELALYSTDYTATRIMELPSCKDLGGEEFANDGFCPVDYFVPTYYELETISDYEGEKPVRRLSNVNNPKEPPIDERIDTHTWTNLNTNLQQSSKSLYRALTPTLYYPFGFVAGCVWGDDSTDKVQYLDLSKADQGILVREEKFGYIELPDNVSLSDAIDMSDYLYDHDGEWAHEIRINVMQRFFLRTGKSS